MSARRLWPAAVAMAAAVAFSVAAYPRLPERIATHWNAEFEPDGSSPKWQVLVLGIGLWLFVALLAVVVLRIDPRRRSHEQHQGTYWLIMNGVLVMLAAIQALVVANGLGWPIDTARVIPIVTGCLLVLVGNVMPRLRPNWFLGVRTPWTLSSDAVWRRTHRFGAWSLVATGVALAVAGIAPVEWVRSVAWVAVVIGALSTVVYSYVEWVRVGRPERPA